MIAIAREQKKQKDQTCPSFEDLLPAIQRQARMAFRGLPASEREELTAEVVANCYVAYPRLVERGATDVIYATPLAQFAIKQIRSGRRVVGKLICNDVDLLPTP